MFSIQTTHHIMPYSKTTTALCEEPVSKNGSISMNPISNAPGEEIASQYLVLSRAECSIVSQFYKEAFSATNQVFCTIGALCGRLYRCISTGEFSKQIERIVAVAAKQFTQIAVKALLWPFNTTVNTFEMRPLKERGVIFLETQHQPLPEVLAVAAFGCAHFLNLENLEPKTRKECDKNQIPVILVHGFLGRGSSWFYQREILTQAGIRNIFSINLGHPFHSIEEYGDHLAEKIRQVAKVTGKNEVILVCHSMGGLVSRYYRQKLSLKENVHVRSIVTIGSPLAGTPSASLVAWASPAAAQMLPESSFIQDQLGWKALHHDETKYLHIGSDGDKIVPSMSAIAGREDRTETVSLSNIGHTSLLFSQDVASLLIQTIQSLCSKYSRP